MLGIPPLQGNVADYLLERSGAAAWRDRPAQYLETGVVTYGELHDRVGRVAGWLRALGLEPGDRLTMSVMDGPDFAALFLGAIKAGVVPIPINVWLKPADYLYYLNDSAAKALVVDRALVPAIDAIRDRLATVRHFAAIGVDAPGYARFEAALAAAAPARETLPRKPDDTAFWLYSSGSTGDPKGVVHTHDHLYWATELFGMRAQGIVADDVIQCPPKMFFAYGLGNQVYFPVRAGAAVVVNEGPITPARIWALWRRHRPTIVMSVPTLFAGMLALAEKELGQEEARRACGRMRFAVSGGEILPPAVLRRWREFTGVEILDSIGTTEMTHMFTMNRPGQAVPGSCGRIVEGYRYEILDEQGRPVPQGEIGDLHVFGPSAATQYWNKPERSRAVFGRGGVMTGDKVFEDAAGNIFLVGRADDMLRVGGIWVSPAEVEGALAAHPAVLECAVVGRADEHEMIKPHAFVVPREPEAVADAAGRRALEAALLAHVKERLAHIKAPRWIEFVAELPKTATGKIQRFRLRDRAGGDHAGGDRAQ